jgi:hypothetical protein
VSTAETYSKEVFGQTRVDGQADVWTMRAGSSAVTPLTHSTLPHPYQPNSQGDQTMFASKLARRLRLCAPLAALALLALPAVSHGDADPNCDGTGVCTFKFDTGPQPVDPYQVSIPCLTSEEGTATGTGDERVGGNFNLDFENHPFGHSHGSYTETGRIDFPTSGIYVLYSLDARGGGQVGEHRTTVTYTEGGTLRGTVSRADGQPTGQTVSERVLIHFTFIDSGTAGIPFDSDPTDEFIVDIERDRFTCS